MQIDTQKQKEILQQLMTNTNWPGSVLADAYALKLAVDAATVTEAPAERRGSAAK